MITALAIMIAIAGYLQFAGTDLEQEYMTVNDTSTMGTGEVATQHYTTGDLLDLSDADVL